MAFSETNWRLPESDGSLYNPSLEKDACGVGFIVSIDGLATDDIVERGRVLSKRMTHRGGLLGRQ